MFTGNADGLFDDGSQGIYAVGFPDVLTSFGSGASAAINYSGVVSGAAGIAYDGSSGGGKVVYLGFPFETITSSAVRNTYMTDILSFFIPGPMQSLSFDSINLLPDGSLRLVLSGAPGFNVQLLTSTNSSHWSVLANLHNPTGTLQVTNAPASGVPSQLYRARYP
jgi:hypothetical protein